MHAKRPPASDPWRRRAQLLGVLLGAAFTLAGCATPVARIDQRAGELGFARLTLTGEGFDHRAYLRAGPADQVLHVYIENDGRPWRTPTQPGLDPNPGRPLMLEAMALDPAPAVYLGRPCYLSAPMPPACSPLMWTHRRYAPEVVSSMAAALAALRRSQPHRELVLIGHSGGGTLAMLLARQIPGVRAVVTLAGNLDVAGWAKLNGFSPLAGSLDPAAQAPLPDGIAQWHFVGTADRLIPPSLSQGFRQVDPQARIFPVDGQDHACCWLEHWPRVLARLRAEGW